MTTFSQLVDKMVLETRRPDMRTEFCTFLNQTIREVHFEPSRGNVVFFNDNYKEARITVDADSRMLWQIPVVANFQGMAAVRFDNQFTRRGEQIYAKLVPPGPMLESSDYYYYRAGTTFVFGGRIGYGPIGSTISLAWYEYPRALVYYPAGKRPAEYDLEYGFKYNDEMVVDPNDRVEAENMVTNWLLLRWFTVIEEGLRAKIYKRLSDDNRQRTSYSLYMQLRQGLYTSEVADLGGPF